MPEPSSAAANPVRTWLRKFGTWLEEHPGPLDDLQYLSEQVAAAGTPDGVSLLEAVSRGILPPNWWPLDSAERAQALTLVQRAPICLVWAPRANVVRELLAAPDKSARDRVLVARRDSILDDIEDLCVDCHQEETALVCAALREAVAADRAGFHKAAQALCGSIVTSLLTDHYAAPRFGQARTILEAEVPGTARLRFWRRASIQSVLLAAIAQSWPDDPSPVGFNRHRTAHSLDPRQFTPAHAVEGLMLVGGLLRELDEIYATGHGGTATLGSSQEASRTD